MISLLHVFGTEMYMLTTGQNMAAARIWLDIVYTGRWNGAEPYWFYASLLYQSELGQHGTAQLGMMLARFGHVYTATANRAEPCWYHTDTVSSGSANAVLVRIQQLTRRHRTGFTTAVMPQPLITPVEASSATTVKSISHKSVQLPYGWSIQHWQKMTSGVGVG